MGCYTLSNFESVSLIEPRRKVTNALRTKGRGSTCENPCRYGPQNGNHDGNNESNMSISPLRFVSDSTYVHCYIRAASSGRPLGEVLCRGLRLMDGLLLSLLLALRAVRFFVRWSMVTRSFTAAKAFAAVTLAR